MTASTGDLKELAKIAGIDPHDLYRNQDLTGCDLRGQDLRGLNLDGCNLEKAIIDSATKIDPEWDFRAEITNEKYVYCNITRSLNAMILNYMDEVHYTYAAWAQRDLLSRGLGKLITGRYEYYKEIINKNRHLKSLLTERSSVSIKILFRHSRLDIIENKFPKISDEINMPEVILVGLISRKIRYRSKKDYSNVSVNAFYPPRHVKVEGAIDTIG